MSIEMLLAYALVLSVFGLIVWICFVVGINFALHQSRKLHETYNEIRRLKNERKKDE